MSSYPSISRQSVRFATRIPARSAPSDLDPEPPARAVALDESPVSDVIERLPSDQMADGMGHASSMPAEDPLTFELDIDAPLYENEPQADAPQNGFAHSSSDPVWMPLSFSSIDRDDEGSRFSRSIARFRAQGHDFFEIAAMLMMAVLKKKEAMLSDITEIDGSWQASVAWIADMIQEEETRDQIIDAIFLLMDDARIQSRPDLIARQDAILEACGRIRRSGRHKRDQIIMRLGALRDETGIVMERHSGAARLCVPVIAHKEARESETVPFVFVAYPMTGFQRNMKKTLLSIGEFGRNKIAWHQTQAIEALFERMQQQVLSDSRIQEVVFYWETEVERRIALSFMNILSTLWNVPAFGRGEMDFLYMESARQAAIRLASARKPG